MRILTSCAYRIALLQISMQNVKVDYVYNNAISQFCYMFKVCITSHFCVITSIPYRHGYLFNHQWLNYYYTILFSTNISNGLEISLGAKEFLITYFIKPFQEAVSMFCLHRLSQSQLKLLNRKFLVKNYGLYVDIKFFRKSFSSYHFYRARGNVTDYQDLYSSRLNDNIHKTAIHAIFGLIRISFREQYSSPLDCCCTKLI